MRGRKKKQLLETGPGWAGPSYIPQSYFAESALETAGALEAGFPSTDVEANTDF